MLRRPVRGRGDACAGAAALLRLSVGSVIESVVRCRRRTVPVRAWSTNGATPACPRSHMGPASVAQIAGALPDKAGDGDYVAFVALLGSRTIDAG